MPLYQGVPPDHLRSVNECLSSHGAHYPMSVSTQGAIDEAKILAGYVLETFPKLIGAPINSICDVGCAGGHLVLAFLQCGVTAIGLDAHPDAPPCLGAPILLRDAAITLDIIPRVSLAVCLDTAEHVPDYKADKLVENLCSMAPAVYFSAGLPGYEGAHGHVNCQPVNYWAQKFKRFGYHPFADEHRWSDWRMTLKAKIEAGPAGESYCWWSWGEQARLYLKGA